MDIYTYFDLMHKQDGTKKNNNIKSKEPKNNNQIMIKKIRRYNENKVK